MTRYIMIIIQFLYNKFSKEIQKKILPSYILHIVSLLLMLIFAEEYRDQEKLNEDEDKTQGAKQIKIVFQSACSFINLINLYYVVR